MPNNLFISYDLHAPDKNYAKVIEAIKELGNWAKVHYSLYYVNSNYSAQVAAEHVWKAMDANDRLIVIDTSNNTAYWYNLDETVTQYIKNTWTVR